MKNKKWSKLVQIWKNTVKGHTESTEIHRKNSFSHRKRKYTEFLSRWDGWCFYTRKCRKHGKEAHTESAENTEKYSCSLELGDSPPWELDSCVSAFFVSSLYVFPCTTFKQFFWQFTILTMLKEIVKNLLANLFFIKVIFKVLCPKLFFSSLFLLKFFKSTSMSIWFSRTRGE